MQDDVSIRSLSLAEARSRRDELADILLDCVGGGASVSFMAETTREQALAFWDGVISNVAASGAILFGAFDGEGLVGTVQVIFADKPNQPHRGDVAKMLVHRRGRKKGVGASLLAAAEKAALDNGRWLLVLDTVPGTPADRLYARCGWTRVGAIPNYALMPDGALCDTMMFYKDLRSVAR